MDNYAFTEDIFIWAVGPPAQCDHC